MEKVTTGDILLFGNNTLTGFLLKTFTLSDWSHAGIAVRLKDGKVVKEGGRLGVIEMNSGKRKDMLTGSIKDGFGISEIEFSCSEQDIVAVRKLKSQAVEQDTLINRTTSFLEQAAAVKFPETSLPFVEVWMERRLSDSEQTNEMICSEMMGHYYLHLFMGCDLRDIFGKKAAPVAKLMGPYHFDNRITSDSRYFENEVKTVHLGKMDTSILVQPVILALFLGAIFLTLTRQEDPEQASLK